MKKKLIVYGVHAALVLGLAVLVYSNLLPRLNLNDPIYQVYADVPTAWNVRCWSDAFFLIGILWAGMGALMWIATTGFFDLLRYACHSIWMIFNPMKSMDDIEKYYDYKVLRAEARAAKPSRHFSTLIVGAAVLAVAFVLAMINLNMIGG